MMTSAFALSQILSIVSKRKDNEKFLTAAADALGLEGKEAELEVLSQLIRLVKTIDEDIKALDLDEVTTRTLTNEAAPFSGLKNYSHIHYTIQQAKGSFLKPDHLVGLNRLHAAFAHSRPLDSLSDDARELAKEFRESIDKVLESDIPENLKIDICRYLRQIVASLENYYFFSGAQLDHSLQALVGTLVLNPEVATEHEDAISPVRAVVARLLSTFSDAGKYTSIARKIAEDGKAILEVFNSSGN